MAKAKKGKLTIEDALVPVEEQPYKIPENWCWTSLSSVATWGSGGTPSRKNPDYYGGNIPWIKTGELEDGYIFDSEEKITEDAVAHSSAKLFPIDSVLIAMYGATIGKTAILGIPATTNQACACAKCSDALDNKYLFYYLRSQKDSFMAKGKGGAQPNISQDIIKGHPIPLPPLAEQKRIVEQIENLFSKLDEAKVKAQFVVDSYDERKAAILYSAFTGKLSQSWRETNVNAASESLEAMYSKAVITDNTPCELPDNWCWVKMGALGYTNIGLTYSPSDKSDEGTIVLRSSNIQDGQMDYEDIVRVNMDIPDNKMCKKGDLLICARNGSKALVGKTAIVDKDGMSYGAFMAIFRSEYNKYIYYFMSSPFFRNLIDSDVSTTTINQVTQGIIKNLMFPLAPVKEQEYISDKLKDILDKERSVRDMAVEAIENIELTKKAILAKAFRGELGTNIPEEVSSLELLKQILD